MASSAEDHHYHHHLSNANNPYGTTAAPPPTPSTQTNLLSTSEAADALSRLLHRLPPTLSLSLPSRRSSATATTITPPVVSLSDNTPTLHANILSAAAQLGFFQLTDHSVPTHLAHSAESNSRCLFNDQKHLHFPKTWPLGFDADDDDKTAAGGGSLCLDSSCSVESSESLDLTSLREFTREMEKIGLKVIKALSCALGFENPVSDDHTRVCSLMWVSEGCSGNTSRQASSGRMYPYVVGLQYQIRREKHSVLADSGWVSVLPQLDSILVTIGDIAQVWSNGKLKKVRGRPMPNLGEGDNSQAISMCLLVTLPIDSTVSPLLPKLAHIIAECSGKNKGDYEDENCSDTPEEERLYNSFSFEDYAWRVYHERLPLKDPLVRYRV